MLFKCYSNSHCTGSEAKRCNSGLTCQTYNQNKNSMESGKYVDLMKKQPVVLYGGPEVQKLNQMHLYLVVYKQDNNRVHQTTTCQAV